MFSWLKRWNKPREMDHLAKRHNTSGEENTSRNCIRKRNSSYICNMPYKDRFYSTEEDTHRNRYYRADEHMHGNSCYSTEDTSTCTGIGTTVLKSTHRNTIQIQFIRMLYSANGGSCMKLQKCHKNFRNPAP